MLLESPNLACWEEVKVTRSEVVGSSEKVRMSGTVIGADSREKEGKRSLRFKLGYKLAARGDSLIKSKLLHQLTEYALFILFVKRLGVFQLTS